MVAEEQVWEALAEIPDPEIPVISLVELGVIRGVEIEDGRVRVDFTPTFLGCPAVEVMQTAMAERIRELGAEPEVRVLADDSWSSDRITPEGRENGCPNDGGPSGEKLPAGRAARNARSGVDRSGACAIARRLILVWPLRESPDPTAARKKSPSVWFTSRSPTMPTLSTSA